MLTKLRKHLTYANLMATLAVFIAMGGSAYAAVVITGKNVKNSSLTGVDVKNESLTGADVKRLTGKDVTDGSLLAQDFKPGQLPAGPQGPQGSQGPQGERGPQGPADGPAGGDLTGRYPDPSLAGPEGWHVIGAPNEPSFFHSNAWWCEHARQWRNKGGLVDTVAAFYRDRSGRVHLKGAVTGGTVGSPFCPIFFLPDGYAPAKFHRVAVPANGGFAEVVISPNGSVNVVVGSNVAVSLDNISFRPDN